MDFITKCSYLHHAKSIAVPLFMDVHKGAEFTLEDVKRNHLADLEVQSKYGVRYVQYWVNDDAGMVFCLMEGPNKEACEKVHQEAHGDIACNVIQVEKGDYELLMGVTTIDEFEMAHNLQGEVDSGYRIFVSINFIGPEKLLIEPEFLTGKILRELGGRELIHPGPEIMGVFNSCRQAVQCAKSIQSEMKDFLFQQDLMDRVEFRIAVAAGEPVTNNDGLFGDTLQLVSRLNSLTGKNQIILSSLVKDLCKERDEGKHADEGLFKVLTPSDERLLNRVMEVAESRLNDHQFSVSSLSKEVGMSRPQLYRKLAYLTEISPNDFIRELRLKKAEKLMRRKEQNISEIALEVGFGNPSYFSKCFYNRFGTLPSQYLEIV